MKREKAMIQIQGKSYALRLVVFVLLASVLACQVPESAGSTSADEAVMASAVASTRTAKSVAAAEEGGGDSQPPTSTPRPTQTNTPQPTINAQFDVEFQYVEKCPPGEWFIQFRFRNTGDITFRTYEVSVEDTVTGEIVQLTKGGEFYQWENCEVLDSDKSIGSGKTGHLASQGLSSDPGGHEIKAVVKACSMEGIADMCHEEVFTFTP